MANKQVTAIPFEFFASFERIEEGTRGLVGIGDDAQ